jgi:hypothetical protein
MRGYKLRSGVYWQGALKQKGVKDIFVRVYISVTHWHSHFVTVVNVCIWTEKVFGIIYVLGFVHYLLFKTVKIVGFRDIIGPILR